MSSSSRSSAVNSACAPNGSSGSGSAVSEKLRARLLGGLSKARDRPGRGAGPPLCFLWLLGAGVPAMTSFCPQRPRTPSAAPSAESPTWPNRPRAAARFSYERLPSLRANPLSASGRGGMTCTERAVTPDRFLLQSGLGTAKSPLVPGRCAVLSWLPVLRDRGASVRPHLWLSPLALRGIQSALSRDGQQPGVTHRACPACHVSGDSLALGRRDLPE